MEDIPMSSSINELENIEESSSEESPSKIINNNISENNDILIPDNKIDYKNINLLTQNNKINDIKNIDEDIKILTCH